LKESAEYSQSISKAYNIDEEKELSGLLLQFGQFAISTNEIETGYQMLKEAATIFSNIGNKLEALRCLTILITKLQHGTIRRL